MASYYPEYARLARRTPARFMVSYSHFGPGDLLNDEYLLVLSGSRSALSLRQEPGQCLTAAGAKKRLFSRFSTMIQLGSVNAKTVPQILSYEEWPQTLKPPPRVVPYSVW